MAEKGDDRTGRKNGGRVEEKQEGEQCASLEKERKDGCNIPHITSPFYLKMEESSFFAGGSVSSGSEQNGSSGSAD